MSAMLYASPTNHCRVPRWLAHHAQRREARLTLLLDPRPALRRHRQMLDPESRRRDEGLVAVLLEGHPLQHLGPLADDPGRSRVPSARYQQIAFDSARHVPSSSSRTGILPFGLRARNLGCASRRRRCRSRSARTGSRAATTAAAPCSRFRKGGSRTAGASLPASLREPPALDNVAASRPLASRDLAAPLAAMR